VTSTAAPKWLLGLGFRVAQAELLNDSVDGYCVRNSAEWSEVSVVRAGSVVVVASPLVVVSPALVAVVLPVAVVVVSPTAVVVVSPEAVVLAPAAVVVSIDVVTVVDELVAVPPPQATRATAMAASKRTLAVERKMVLRMVTPSRSREIAMVVYDDIPGNYAPSRIK